MQTLSFLPINEKHDNLEVVFLWKINIFLGPILSPILGPVHVLYYASSLSMKYFLCPDVDPRQSIKFCFLQLSYILHPLNAKI